MAGVSSQARSTARARRTALRACGHGGEGQERRYGQAGLSAKCVLLLKMNPQGTQTPLLQITFFSMSGRAGRVGPLLAGLGGSAAQPARHIPTRRCLWRCCCSCLRAAAVLCRAVLEVPRLAEEGSML